MLFRQNWYMMQILAEQVHWISPKHIYSSTALQKAYLGGPRRRAELPFHACPRQAATRQHPAPSSHELCRKDEKSKRHQPLPGTWGICLWFCWRPELCLPWPAVFLLHPRCLLPSSPSHRAHADLDHHHIPSSISAAPNTYSSTCIRSKNDPTRGPQDFKTGADYQGDQHCFCTGCGAPAPRKRMENPHSPGTPTQGSK